MTTLNLGCGTKVSASADVMNIDWSIYLRLKQSRILRTVVPFFLRGERQKRFLTLPDNIMVHNLAHGIPFASNSVDAVYHSHMLEHLDRDVAERFLLEVKRVLKPGGYQRIVVPDLEHICRAYVAHLTACENDPREADRHDAYVTTLLEQSVRREAYGTSQQKPLRRFIENRIRGDARAQGETHQWMYDRFNLTALLVKLGYRNPRVQSYNTSSIPNWNQYGLDVNEQGRPHIPDSLYLEAQK